MASLATMTTPPKDVPTSQATPAYQLPASKPITPPSATPESTTPESDPQALFIAATGFEGAKEGYFFSTGYEGTGYYLDLPLPERMANDAAAAPLPRKGGCLAQCSSGMSSCTVC
eukprot:TRINITY_DN9396_c0_g1_i2.p1 TRINITY_DN9396_c0_g1~~TRINITY_DN9396_c0_g1_i2.p1  ORF type:complete len:115 (-),score=16.77 TRINITY_DN9396_c0_g1_i2:369-713(-)